MVIKIINHLLFKIKRIYHEQIIFKSNDQKKIFHKIYKNNYWGSKISKSGPGSDLINTRNIRKNLPILIRKYNIKSIFDAPCGDFFWFNKIISKINVKYIGVDIVEDLITNNKSKFGNNKIKFKKLNMINSTYPKSDLLICRALFFHLDFKSIKKILINIKKSDIKYVLLTNSSTKKKFNNNDITPGDYRPLNLFKYPFNFKKNYIYKFADTRFPNTKIIDQEMILWKKNDLIKNLKFFL